MPSVSDKQHGLMAGCLDPKFRKKRKAKGKPCPPLKVCREFVRADAKKD